MEKPFSYTTEHIPLPEKPQAGYTLLVFIDEKRLDSLYEKVDAGEDVDKFEKWMQLIWGKDLDTFDTMLETILHTDNAEIQEYFEISKDDNEFISSLHYTTEAQHARMFDLYSKIQDKFGKLIFNSKNKKDLRPLLRSLIVEYNEVFINKAGLLQEKLPEYKQEFLTKLSTFLDPTKYDLNRAKDIIMNTPVEFIDTLTDEEFAGSVDADNDITLALGVGPFYTEDKELLDITSEEYDVRDLYVDNTKNTYFHELLHAISSDRKKMTLAWKGEASSQNRTITTKNKTGVNFHGVKNRFTWLNEALTEYIRMQITDDFKERSYGDEIRLYTLLGDKLPDKKAWIDLQDTYFADIMLNVSNPINIWKENRKRIEDSIGDKNRNFLVRLDNWIEANGGMPEGVKKAHEIISQWEDGKPRPEDFYSKTE